MSLDSNCAPWSGCMCLGSPKYENGLWSKALITVSALPSGMAIASFHPVKWSETTSITLFHLGVIVKGLTVSMDTTCHGLPANNLCLHCIGGCLLLLVSWRTSHVLMSLLMSEIMLGKTSPIWSDCMYFWCLHSARCGIFLLPPIAYF